MYALYNKIIKRNVTFGEQIKEFEMGTRKLNLGEGRFVQ